MVNLINLEIPPQDQGNKIDLGTPQPSPLPPFKVQDRSQKYDFALGNDSPGQDSIYQQIVSGNEDQLRQYAAQKQDAVANGMRAELIANYTQAKAKAGEPLTPEEVQVLDSLTYEQITNPKTVMEKLYAARQMSALVNNTPVQVDANKEDPYVANTLQDAAEQGIAVNQKAWNLLEDLKARQQHEGILNKATDIAGQLLPFMSQWNKHNVVRAPYPTSYWTGKNNVEQYAYINSLPYDQQFAALEAGVNDLANKNINDAIDFLEGFLSYGSSKQFLDTAINVADISAVVSPLVKSGVKAGVGAVTKAVSERQAAKLTAKNAARVQQLSKDITGLEQEAARLESQAQAAYESGYDDIAQQYLDDAQGIRKQIDDHEAEIASLSPLSANEKLAKALKDTVKGTDGASKPDITEAASAAGREDIAATNDVIKNLEQAAAPTPEGQADLLVRAIPSFMDPGRTFRAASKLTREYSAELTDWLGTRSGEFVQFLSQGGSAASLSGKALAEAISKGKEDLLDYVSRLGLTNNVIDVDQVVKAEDTAGNATFNVLRLGKADGEFFNSEAEARNFINWSNFHRAGHGGELIDGATVEQQGGKYYIQIARPISETNPEIKDFIVETASETPKNSFSTFLDGFGLAKFLGPSNVLSESQRGARTSAVNRMSELARLFKEAGKPLTKLGPRSRKDLRRFVDLMRREEYIDSEGVSRKGIELSTQGDFERRWLAEFNRLPTDKESKAFWSHRLVNQMDYVLRNLELYHYKVRQGGISVQFSKDGVFHDAIPLKKFKWDTKDKGNIAVQSDQGPKMFLGQFMNDEKRARLEDLLNNQGYELFQMFEPWSINPGGKPVHFVLAKPTARRNMSWKQFEYRGPDHIKYDYQNKVSVGNIYHSDDGRVYHKGDITIAMATSGPRADELASKLETARNLYNAGDTAAFDKFVSENLPMEPSWLKKRFKLGPDNGGLPTDNPIVALKFGERTMDHSVYRNMLKDESVATDWAQSDLNLMKGANLEYTGKRGWEVQATADTENPMFEMVSPRLVDPFTTMAQSVQRLISNRFLQPYQLRSAEHFVEEFHDVLDLPGPVGRELDFARENPMAILRNPVFKKNPRDRAKLAAAKQFQLAATHLIGTSTDLGRHMRWVEQKLIDSVAGKYGEAAADFTYEKIVPIVRKLDPIKATRQLAFHAKLGFFVPTQLLLQAQTATIAVAVGGKHGIPGMAGGFLVQLAHALDKPEIIDHFAKLASKMGWKEGDWKEMYNLMKRTGTLNIGPQHAWRSDALDPTIFQGKFGSFLDKGLWFFNNGERFNHVTGMGIAYREWRLAHPFEKLTRASEEQILKRYDDLTINMTHASSSALNRGLGAVTGQFWSYTERLAELLWGGRLTRAEKLRVFGTLAGMYGIPTAFAGWTMGGEQVLQLAGQAGLPVPESLRIGTAYDDIRAQLLKRGITNNAFVESLVEGFPQLLLRAIFGTEYNWGQRFGPNGLPLFDDLASQKSFLEILTGASGSVAGDFFRSSMPVAMDLFDWALGNGGAKATTMQDIADFGSSWSAVSQGIKLYTALTMHSYLDTKKGIVDDNVTTSEGFIMGLTGLTPQRINDRLIINQAVQAKDDARKFWRDQAAKYIRLYWRADNPDDRQAYKDKAWHALNAGGFDPVERGDILATYTSEVFTSVEKSQQQLKREFPQE